MKTRENFIYSEIRKGLSLNKITLKDFANTLEVSYQTAYHYARGTLKPSSEFIAEVVALLGFDPYKRFPEQEYQPPQAT